MKDIKILKVPSDEESASWRQKFYFWRAVLQILGSKAHFLKIFQDYFEISKIVQKLFFCEKSWFGAHIKFC